MPDNPRTPKFERRTRTDGAEFPSVIIYDPAINRVLCTLHCYSHDPSETEHVADVFIIALDHENWDRGRHGVDPLPRW